MQGWRARAVPVMAAIAMAALLAFGARLAHGQDRLAQYKTQFAAEKDPVRKAKLLQKISAPQFEAVHRQVQSGNLEQGVTSLESFKDDCAATHQLLKAKGVDPEQRPAGFKELQISVRQTLNRLSELLAGLSGDDQKPFLLVRDQLEELDSELIRELFPRQSKPGSQTNPKPSTKDNKQ